MSSSKRGVYSYDRVSAFYDSIAEWYSRGRIGRSKRLFLEYLVPGERVLFAGVGCGKDAYAAAEVGAQVTGVDVSPRMLAVCAKRFERAGLSAEWIECDFARLPVERGFDVVVAHYFLNLFGEPRLSEMLAHLVAHLAPGGRLVIADFAPPTGGLGSRLVTEAYYRPVNWIASILGLCELHAIPRYPCLLSRFGLRVERNERYRVGASRAPAYSTIVAVPRGSALRSRSRSSPLSSTSRSRS